MVDRNVYLNGLFNSLADTTRRDILWRLIDRQYTVSQIAEKYTMSLAAVAKHVNVLEKAQLITKHRRGNQQVVSIAPDALQEAAYYLKQYEILWDRRFARRDDKGPE